MILYPVIVLGGLGIFWAAVLGFSSVKLAVKKDETLEGIIRCLPGINCGACGFPGCEGYGEAVLFKDEALNLCKPGGKETADKIAALLCIEPPLPAEKMAACVFCKGKKGVAAGKYEYRGVPRCAISIKYFSGSKECPYSCLGMGDCIEACPFDAIKMGPGDIPVIDIEKCNACGLCIAACPKKVIRLRPAGKSVHVLCSSTDKGPVVKNYCKTGCIGCAICVKACPQNALEMKNNLAVIDYSKCDNCGVCIEKCPVKTIEAVPD